MKKLPILAIATLLLSSNLVAALPPLYQSAREIKAILTTSDIMKEIPSGEAIEYIKLAEDSEKKKDGVSYVIGTTHTQVLVNVDYVKPHKIGPLEFKLEVAGVEKR